MWISLTILFAAMTLAGPSLAESYPIAGTVPDRRPADAPRMTGPLRDAAWWRAFHPGIAHPIPPNLVSEGQGTWYTPFNRPGMPPPYDLRNWHAASPVAR